MLFARLEKKGKYIDAWSERRMALDTETGMLYLTGKETNVRVLWRHKVKVMRIIAKANTVNIDYNAPDFKIHDLLTFRLEGSVRDLDPSFISHLEEPVCDNAVVIPFSSHYVRDDSDAGSGEMVVWYMRFNSQSDFMKVYATIRDILIKQELRPPQFWGLPKMDPRIGVPLAEPPLYLWCNFRAIKHSVFYACVHGYMAVRSADALSTVTPVTLHKDPLYLTLFDKSVMVFNENKHVVAGIPTTDINSLHYATINVGDSVRDPKNEKCRCFLVFTSNSEKYSDILFVPTLERFAEANEKNVPAAQVNCVTTALSQLAPVTRHLLEQEGRTDVPPTEVINAMELITGHENDVESSGGGLLDVYAKVAETMRPFRLPETPGTDEEEHISSELIAKLPPPYRLSELATEFGIKAKETLTQYPHTSEYFSSTATVKDPTCPETKENPLHGFYRFSACM